MSYLEMYQEAMDVTGGYYKGFNEGNALSLYVFEKFGVNAADNTSAHDALCDVLVK